MSSFLELIYIVQYFCGLIAIFCEEMLGVDTYHTQY
jgi:hypothetical protein